MTHICYVCGREKRCDGCKAPNDMVRCGRCPRFILFLYVMRCVAQNPAKAYEQLLWEFAPEVKS